MREEMLLRIGIFSDVHGNDEALTNVLNALNQENVERLICLGDLVGYGPEPNLCTRLVHEATPHIIAGNHDHAAVGLTSTDYFNTYARIAIEWTMEILTSEAAAHLKNLPLILEEEEATFVHATPKDPEEWHYVLTVQEARNQFQRLKTWLCFIGHSHLPLAFVQNSQGEITVQNAGNLFLEPDKRYIINVGSVGQPRDGDPRASWGVWDTDKKRFQLKRSAYPVDRVQEKMQKAKLPHYLIQRLSAGQ
jgi:predicted phosphodiesterase